MKVSDYLVKRLEETGIEHVFGITGGAIIHLFDSLGKSQKIQIICPQQEQAAAMAADAYARVSGNIGVGIATSGPGATNLLTGVCCSYFDSTPTLFFTGQVPSSQLKGNIPVRQVGFQETDISSIFKEVTKYSQLVFKPDRVRYEFEKALYLCKTGRPGPVLLDITDDVQRAEINPDNLESYSPEVKMQNPRLKEDIQKAFEMLYQSKRPVVILGSGLRLSGLEEKTKQLVKKLDVPIVLTWGTLDFFPDNYPLSARDFGVTANRPGNFAVQNSDFILALGTRLDTHETGNDLRKFARGAKKVAVDIDSSELNKYAIRGMPLDIGINCDLRDFFDSLPELQNANVSEWKRKVIEWKEKYPICQKEYFEEKKKVNPYVFLKKLSEQTSRGDVIIPEAGCNVTWSMQGYQVKEGQRLFSAFNHSPMGYGLPASIGASLGGGRRVISIIGDGGFMMNEQELATIAKHNLAIKIFVLNNEGYGMIKQTQETWLDSRYVASSEKDIFIPDIRSIAKAHGIKKTFQIKNHKELESGIERVLAQDGPTLCEVLINPNARIWPKLTFGKPIEDAEPLLDRTEFKENMIVPLLS
jgi:acetolactate synthase-1/2/3 large subunit